MRLLDAGDHDPSLRAVARAAGVSAMAPYRHFPDKTALLGAVAAVRDRILQSTLLEQRLASLSHRERQVLRQIVEGLTAKQIATRLDISPRTVETYREHLMRKTGATSLAQLVRFAVEARVTCVPL